MCSFNKQKTNIRRLLWKRKWYNLPLFNCYPEKVTPAAPPASSADLAAGSGDRQTRESSAVGYSIWHHQTVAARRISMWPKPGTETSFPRRPPGGWGFRFSTAQLAASRPSVHLPLVPPRFVGLVHLNRNLRDPGTGRQNSSHPQWLCWSSPCRASPCSALSSSSCSGSCTWCQSFTCKLTAKLS